MRKQHVAPISIDTFDKYYRSHHCASAVCAKSITTISKFCKHFACKLKISGTQFFIFEVTKWQWNSQKVKIVCQIQCHQIFYLRTFSFIMALERWERKTLACGASRTICRRWDDWLGFTAFNAFFLAGLVSYASQHQKYTSEPNYNPASHYHTQFCQLKEHRQEYARNPRHRRLAVQCSSSPSSLCDAPSGTLIASIWVHRRRDGAHVQLQSTNRTAPITPRYKHPSWRDGVSVAHSANYTTFLRTPCTRIMWNHADYINPSTSLAWPRRALFSLCIPERTSSRNSVHIHPRAHSSIAPSEHWCLLTAGLHTV